MWIKREIEDTLARLGQQRPVVLLTGARQAGKTSLLKKLFPSHVYVSLDLPRLAEEAEEAGSLFLEKYPPPQSLTRFSTRHNCSVISNIARLCQSGPPSGSVFLSRP
jgi:predicted ATPase